MELDLSGQAHLTEASEVLQTPAVHANLGITGDGVTIAILDSGVDAAHPDLADRVVAQHCFTEHGCDPNAPDDPSGPSESSFAVDDTGHGTSVAGVVVGKGALASAGLAPGAKVIAVRVLTRNSGRLSDWLAGLDWLLDNLSVQPFQVVNMSFGTAELFNSSCDDQVPAMALAISQLSAAGVVVFASTGNEGSATSISSPACNSGVVGVGATYDDAWSRIPAAGTFQSLLAGEFADCFDALTTTNTVACFANSSPNVRIVAPGAIISAPFPLSLNSSGVQTVVGTSHASPAAAAVAALMLEANATMAPPDVAAVLIGTGVTVIDVKNGVSLTRIDAREAVGGAACLGKPDGASCDDADSCSQGDVCFGGTCGGATAASDDERCNDGNACTEAESCVDGKCVGGERRRCDASGVCDESGLCHVTDGDCSVLLKANGSLCDDHDLCTLNDVCIGGECSGAQRCESGGSCVESSTCDSLTGRCEQTEKSDGAWCAGGVCIGGRCGTGLDEVSDDDLVPAGGCSCLFVAPRAVPAPVLIAFALALGYMRRRRAAHGRRSEMTPGARPRRLRVIA